MLTLVATGAITIETTKSKSIMLPKDLDDGSGRSMLAGEMPPMGM
jgi:hypothetical protein